MNKKLIENYQTNLREEYSETLGGDPEDVISDVNEIINALNTIDTSSFGSHIAKQMVEDFITKCNEQIEKINK